MTPKTPILKTFTAATLAIASLAAALPAAAQDTRAVRHADLNLESADGQARLDGRILRAARDLCDADYRVRPLAEQRAVTKCLADAVASTRQQVADARSAPAYGG